MPQMQQPMDVVSINATLLVVKKAFKNRSLKAFKLSLGVKPL